jgi:hypothetical protein
MMVNYAQKEQRMKQKHDVMSMLSDKKVSTLIKQLRIPHQDDNGAKMMKGIYSLGSYIQALVSESLRSNNITGGHKMPL